MIEQNFAFRDPFIRHIIEKADANVTNKLHHSCKLFFLMKPKIVVRWITYNTTNGWRYTHKRQVYKPIDLQLVNPRQLWITHCFIIHYGADIFQWPPNDAAALISSKIYSFGVHAILLRQHLLLSQLELILCNAKNATIYHCTFAYDDQPNSSISHGAIMKLFPKCFFYFDSIVPY